MSHNRKSKTLRFIMEDGSEAQLQKRINEHISRGAKQVSEITSFQIYKKEYKATGYKKAPLDFDSYRDMTRFRVVMEVTKKGPGGNI